jgi:ABC-type enterochelin transport system ATPase subunit
MNTNIGKLMGLITCGNCKVVDASTNAEEKDKVFSLVRRTNKYPFDVDFEKLMAYGFYPVRMHKLNGKDEIVFRTK